MRFRKKVMLGVAVVMAASVGSGANSLYNVSKVAESVNFSSVAASPLLIGVISLSESYQKLESFFGPVTKDCENLEGASRYLSLSQDSQRVQLATLKKLALQANARNELERYEFSGNKIFRTRQALLDVCHRVTRLKGNLSMAENGLEDLATRISIDTTLNILRLEERLSRTGNGSRELYYPYAGDVPRPLPLAETERRSTLRVLKQFYNLKIIASEMLNLGTLLPSAGQTYQLDRMKKGYWLKFLGLERNVHELKDYFVSEGREGDYQRLIEWIGSAKQLAHVSAQSVFNSKTALIEVEKIKKGLVFRLQREQGQYSVALLNIMDVAQRINRIAQQRTEQRTMAANWEIGLSVLASTALLLVMGVFFRNSVTKPLEMLSDNVSGAGAGTSTDKDPVDAALLERLDEIGDLARKFSKTFLALSKAKQELQEASRAELSLQRDRLRGAVENMPQGLYMLDREGRIILANRRLMEICNLDPDLSLVGKSVGEFLALCRSSGAGARRTISDDLVSKGDERDHDFHTIQRVVELEDGRIVTMTVMRLSDGGHVVTQEDITDKQAAAEKIAHMALHDGLTGLANRNNFRRHLIAQGIGDKNRQQGALLFLDLDRFKLVNDTLGHPVGDALLVQVAERLRNTIGENCFAARLGGDEFAVFQSSPAQPESAQLLADRLIRTISEPYTVDGHQIVIGTSVGIAISPSDGGDADELSKNADLALYCAKHEGRGQYAFFEASMDRKIREWRQMEHDLRKALVKKQFELYYQPIVTLETGKIRGFEALIRWKHPQRGFVSPAEFIPVAEEAGLIAEIGSWILDEACNMAITWPGDTSIAVNISPLQLGTSVLPLKIASVLSRTGIRPDRLMLEITEGVFLDDTEKTIADLNAIRALGCRFSMDDFGTGYSSLSYIRKFPFEKIKIDKSFVQGLGHDPESEAIIRAVTTLCRDLGMATTAEGVETAEQADKLLQLGCRFAQGYYFGRPMPAINTYDCFAEPMPQSA